jgi:hypothetical protein
MTHAADPLSAAVALYVPVAVTNRSSAMSRSGVVMMRLVKFVPAPENPPAVMPAPKISALGTVVVTAPLLADALVPDADVPATSGATGSRPLYSVIRRSTNGVAVLNVTVTVFVPAAAALIFLA